MIRARRYRRWGAGMLGIGAAAQFGGCLPDNAFGTVLVEQITNTLGIGAQGITGLFFGLPDLILNTLTLQFLQTIIGS